MSDKTPKKLSEIEAAIHLKISPELLVYFTQRSVKSGETRKLGYTAKDGLRWFARADLDGYDMYLREPWPKKEGAQRPHLPKKIREDIKLEAFCACAVCGREAAGEAAHIEPVSATKSHHPANLIWLCSYHHTMVDQVAVSYDVNLSTVVGLKEMLVGRRMTRLHAERAASAQFFELIRRIEKVAAMLDQTEHAKAKKGLEAMGQDDIAALEKVAAKVVAGYQGATADTKAATLNTFATSIQSSLATSRKPAKRIKKGIIALVADQAGQARDRYLKETGQVDCPVCAGAGNHQGSPCDACGGEGALPAERARWIDVSDYDLVTCPLCEGSRRHDGEDCPECGGEGEYQRRYLAEYDAARYQQVDCPLCEGTGRHDGEECPECRGNRRMEKRHADRVDLDSYNDVACPLCDERGEDPDCPVCEGRFRIEAWRAAQVELRDYRERDCKLCEGSGVFDGNDCSPCHGEGKLEGRYYDNIDWRRWETVECPKCDGKGGNRYDDCRYCDGNGTMYRHQAWDID